MRNGLQLFFLSFAAKVRITAGVALSMPFFNHRTVKSTNMSKRRRSKDTDLPGQRAGIPPFVAARSEPFFECNAFFGDSDVKFVKIHTKKKKIFFDIS